MIQAVAAFLTLWLLYCSPSAQTLLTLEQALATGLQNNYSLSLSHDKTEIAATEIRSGQGRFLPSASADLTQSGKLSGDAPQTRIGGSLNWLVFDGFQTHYTYHQLKLQGQSAMLEDRAALEALIESIMLAYYDIVQQNQKLGAIHDLLAVSLERSKLANAKLEIGSGSRLDYLQSLADLNLDSSSYLNQDVSLHIAKVKLNQIMARDPGLDFQVTDSIPLEREQPLEEWRNIVMENNSAVAAAKARRDAAVSGVYAARGHWFPSLNTGLAYSTAPDAINRAAASYSGDLTYSVMLTLPLFDRLATPTGVTRAKLELHQEETRMKLAESDALTNFELARSQYVTGLRLVTLEERNLQVSKLQAEGAQERYRVGTSTPLEFRDAQTRLLDAEVRLITARQKVKVAETALRRLAGHLVKQVQVPTLTEGK